MAVPVKDYTGEVIAAMSISGPTVRMAMERIDRELPTPVVSTADKTSQKLGIN